MLCETKSDLHRCQVFKQLMLRRAFGALFFRRRTSSLYLQALLRYLCLTINNDSKSLRTPSSFLTMPVSGGAIPHFWRNPIRYCRWAAHEQPALYYSILIGVSGPVALVVVPPIKRYYGWENRPRVPKTYPGMFPALSQWLNEALG